jgi:acetylglutamate kinase
VSEARPLVVLKCGGAVAGSAAADIAALVVELDREQDVVVVHGAGPQISSEMDRRGLEVAFVEGRRVTRAAALDVVRESLLEVNYALCTAIGARAVGLMGDEVGLQAVQVPRLGLVGDPVPSRPSRIVEAIADGDIPVVAPLAEGPLNVNADEAAVALAAGLKAERVVFVTDVPGLFVDGAVVPSISVGEAERLLSEDVLRNGIVPKVRAAMQAVRLGMRAEIGRTRVTA